ncbi:MAG: alpha-(1-_3)-arabinofuranosyltransferase domain-containing protein, partial [Thermocrispum sp.]
STLAETVRGLLDGPLAPFRNVHKFEPVLRLPLMLCLAHAMSSRWLPARLPSWRAVQTTVAAALVVVLAAPAWLGMLRPGPGWEKMPDYWRQALDWVAADDPDGRTLLLPATGFGLYQWGDTIDEPAQTLATAPWSVRNQVPLGSAGNTRLMDAIQDAVDTGLGSPALADLLSRSGYDYLLVRNDLDAPSTKAPPRTVMRQALVRSPGIERVKTFGPKLDLPDISVAGAADQGAPPVPAIEVYRVGGESHRAQTTELAGVPTVSGGPESLLQLLEQGLIEPGQPTLFAEDRESGAPAWLVADGLRKRERNVGIVRRNTGATMTVDEQPRMVRPARDIVPFTGDRHTTTAEYTGISSITASSSRGFADAFGAPDRGHLPFAAVDGDPATSWRSSSLSGAAGQWLEVTFDRPRLVGEIVLRFVKNLHVGQPVRKIRIETDLGSVDTGVVDDFGPQTFGIPKGITSRLRITVLEVEQGSDPGDVAISELSVPGVKPTRALRVPIDVVPPAGVAPTFSFSRGSDAIPACFTLDDDSVRCDEEQATIGEEPLGPRRVFRTGEAAMYRGSVTVTPAYSGELPLSGSGVTAAATSQLAGDPAASAYSAIDDDAATAWIPDGHNMRPALTLRFPQPRRITSLKLHHKKYPVTSRATVVRLITPFGAQSVRVARDGTVDLPRAMNTNELQIRVDRIARRAADVRFPNAPAPAGIFEVDVNGERVVREIDEDQRFTVPCELGPTVRIDDRRFTTTVTGTVGQYRRSEPMRAELCAGRKPAGRFEMLPGIHRLTSTPSPQFVVRDIALTPAEAAPLPVRERETTVRSWGVSQRSVQVGPGDEALLTLTENANAGWQATLGGRTLQPTRVDGWRQAWVVPAGAGGTVQLEFTPDGLYRLGLIAGAAAVIGFLILLLLPQRRTTTPADPRPTRSRWPYGVAAGVLLLLGSWVAALALAVAVSLGVRWRRAPVVLAGCGAGIAVVTAVWGAAARWPEYAYTWYAQAAWLTVLAGLIAAALTPAARAVVRRLRARAAAG